MNAESTEAPTPPVQDHGASRDVIRLRGVGGIGHHGVLAEERRDGQTFLADLTLEVDTRAAAAGDDLGRTVNYAELGHGVVAVIEGEPVHLIETLATRIAAAALAFDAVLRVTVTVHKPEAPVGVPFTDVEVTITRSRADDLSTVSSAQAAEPEAEAEPAVPPAAAAATQSPEPAEDEPAADLHSAPADPTPVVIALGGNVGDVRGTLRAVVADLRTTSGLAVQDVSPLARTAPVLAEGAAEQADFLNAVVLATTTLSPMDLLATLQDVEDAYGRRRTVRWGERTLDLDIILYGSITSQAEELTLPHPRASERAFVLVPWAQTDPDAFLPGLGGGPVATLAETAPDRSGVRWLALDWLDERARPAADPGPAAPADAGGASLSQAAPEAPAADVRHAAAEAPAGDPAEEPAEVAEAEPPSQQPAAEAPSARSAPAADSEPRSGAGTIGRASFPPAVPPTPAAEVPGGASSADAPAPGDQGDQAASVESAQVPAPAEPSAPRTENSAPSEGSWPSAAGSGASGSSPADVGPAPEPDEAEESGLPWAPSRPQTAQPITPKWQPLRRRDDT